MSPSLINLDFADVCYVLKNKGIAHIAMGKAKGENRVIDAVRSAVLSPLLETTIEGAKGIILHIMGGTDLGLNEMTEATELVRNVLDPSANIIFGAGIKEELNDEIVVSIIATGFPDYFKCDSTADIELQKQKALNEYIAEQSQNNIFLSYSHTNSDIADLVESKLMPKLSSKYKIHRDVRDVEFKESFKEFMRTVSKNDYVIIILSDNYIKSQNCMFEVTECMKNNDYSERILCIVLDSTSIYKSEDMLKYSLFWKEELKKKMDMIAVSVKENIISMLSTLTYEVNIINKISNDMIQFFETIKDQKNIPYNALVKSNFSEIVNYIFKRDNIAINQGNDIEFCDKNNINIHQIISSELDELFFDSLIFIFDSKQISISLLQRKFQIGYARAGKIIDDLEACGFINTFSGSKPRTIQIDKKDIKELITELVKNEKYELAGKFRDVSKRIN